MPQANTTKGKPTRLCDMEAVKAFAIAICSIKPQHEKYHSANYTLEYKETVMPDDNHLATVVRTLLVYRYKKLMATIEVVGVEISGSPDTYKYRIRFVDGQVIQYDYIKSAMRRLLDGVILYDFSKQVTTAA